MHLRTVFTVSFVNIWWAANKVTGLFTLWEECGLGNYNPSLPGQFLVWEVFPNLVANSKLWRTLLKPIPVFWSSRVFEHWLIRSGILMDTMKYVHMSNECIYIWTRAMTLQHLLARQFWWLIILEILYYTRGNRVHHSAWYECGLWYSCRFHYNSQPNTDMYIDHERRV